MQKYRRLPDSLRLPGTLRQIGSLRRRNGFSAYLVSVPFAAFSPPLDVSAFACCQRPSDFSASLWFQRSIRQSEEAYVLKGPYIHAKVPTSSG